MSLLSQSKAAANAERRAAWERQQEELRLKWEAEERKRLEEEEKKRQEEEEKKRQEEEQKKLQEEEEKKRQEEEEKKRKEEEEKKLQACAELDGNAEMPVSHGTPLHETSRCSTTGRLGLKSRRAPQREP